MSIAAWILIRINKRPRPLGITISGGSIERIPARAIPSLARSVLERKRKLGQEMKTAASIHLNRDDLPLGGSQLERLVDGHLVEAVLLARHLRRRARDGHLG